MHRFRVFPYAHPVLQAQVSSGLVLVVRSEPDLSVLGLEADPVVLHQGRVQGRIVGEMEGGALGGEKVPLEDVSEAEGQVGGEVGVGGEVVETERPLLHKSLAAPVPARTDPDAVLEKGLVRAGLAVVGQWTG